MKLLKYCIFVLIMFSASCLIGSETIYTLGVKYWNINVDEQYSKDWSEVGDDHVFFNDGSLVGLTFFVNKGKWSAGLSYLGTASEANADHGNHSDYPYSSTMDKTDIDLAITYSLSQNFGLIFDYKMMETKAKYHFDNGFQDEDDYWTYDNHESYEFSGFLVGGYAVAPMQNINSVATLSVTYGWLSVDGTYDDFNNTDPELTDSFGNVLNITSDPATGPAYEIAWKTMLGSSLGIKLGFKAQLFEFEYESTPGEIALKQTDATRGAYLSFEYSF